HSPDHVARLLIISDGRAVGRVLAGVGGIAFGPAALALNSLLHRSPWKQHGAAGESLRAQLAERADIVDDPDSAPVGGQHHVVVALLKRDVAYRQAGGEIVRLELRPALPAVE